MAKILSCEVRNTAIHPLRRFHDTRGAHGDIVYSANINKIAHSAATFEKSASGLYSCESTPLDARSFHGSTL